VSVVGHTYIAVGISSNKKDAMSNAARDFCHYLIRVGEMLPQDVPQLSVDNNLIVFFFLTVFIAQASQLEGPASGCGPSAAYFAGCSDTPIVAPAPFVSTDIKPHIRTPHQEYVEQIRAKREEEVCQV